MFKVGDQISYPLHGAGKIAAIQEKDIDGVKKKYYSLKMPGNVDVMVPTDTAEEHGLRNIIDKTQAEKVFKVLETNGTETSALWNKRYFDNHKKMKTGNIYELADVVRDLSFKQKAKGLAPNDKKMLNSAKQILISELVIAEESSKEEIEQLVDNKITAAYEEYKSEENITTSEISKNIINKFDSFDGTANAN